MNKCNKRGVHRARAIALLACIVLGYSAAYAADATTSASAKRAFAEQVKAALSPADQKWLAKDASEMLSGKAIIAATVRQHVSARFVARKFDEQTLDALVLAALVEVESQAAEHQRSIKEAMTNVREAQEAIAALDRLKATLDSMSDVSQQLAFELQQSMQRFSEAAALMSSMFAINSSTIDAIIGNIRL